MATQKKIYQYTPVPPRASLTQPNTSGTAYTTSSTTDGFPSIQPGAKRYPHWLFYVGIGMCCIVAGFLVWNLLLVPFIQQVQDQWHYGDAKVSLLSADVGHGEVSQFLSFDQNGQITIVEIVGNKVNVYTAGNLIGANRLSRVITLSIDDVNHDGKPDLLIHIGGMSTTEVLFNNGASFQWSKP